MVLWVTVTNNVTPVLFCSVCEDPMMLERSVVSTADPGSTSVVELHEMNKDLFFIKVKIQH